MNQSKIPVRYARALFLLGKEKGIMENLEEDVKQLSAFFENIPDIIPWLRSPIIKMQDKKDLFHKQFRGQLTETSLAFIELVISKKREQYFPGIFRNFLTLQKADAGIKTLVLTAAIDVDEELKQKISSIFGQKHNIRYELNTRVKPSILGGFMIQSDDDLYDASLATELKRLKKELTGQVREQTIKKT